MNGENASQNRPLKKRKIAENQAVSSRVGHGSVFQYTKNQESA